MFFFYPHNALFRESGTLVPKGWKIILPTAVGHQTAGTQKSQNLRLNFGLCSTDLPKMQSQMSSFYCEYKASFLHDETLLRRWPPFFLDWNLCLSAKATVPL